ncbi:MAG: hypothetical protein KME05_16355 [Gloeocapsa sp. UFS-A4-WI-NPMV-4B04]|nr:hypothetical protein [Gloeocapsa sp. UFS-A4-WI-NPMV-4B04]
MKNSIYSINIFEDPNYMLGMTRNTSLGHKQYSFSKLAEEAWEKTADKGLCCRRSDHEIWANWTNSEVVTETGSEARFKEIIGYVKALAELPFLVLQDCGVVCSEAVDQNLKKNYLGLSQWLEFHLLHNVDILLEMNPIYYKHYADKAAVLRDLYGLVQDIYASKNELCRWAKAFSPAQLLFCCMIQFCFKDLQEKNLLPGGRNVEKTEYTQNIFQFVRAVSNHPGQLEIFIPGNKPVFQIPPYHALLITALKLSKQNIYYVKKRRKSSSYQKYLQSLSKSAYYTKNNLQMQQQRLSPDGENLVYPTQYQ